MMVKAMRSDASTMSGLILLMIVPPVCKILEPAQTCRIASQLHTYGSGQAFITDFLAVDDDGNMVTGTNSTVNIMIMRTTWETVTGTNTDTITKESLSTTAVRYQTTVY